MTTGRPAENDQTLANERTVRSFLERAAPIILESRVLDSPRFESVCELADQMGLTRDQLACELRLLQQRGVIASAPWDRLDAGTAPSARPETDEQGDNKGDKESGDQAEIAHPQQTSATDQPLKRPANMPPPPETIEISTTTQAVEALRERAQKILDKRGSITPRTRRKLQKAGKHAGLSTLQVAAVLDTLIDSSRGQAAAEPPALVATDTTSTPAKPTPETRRPPTDDTPPSELFRRWIDQKLSGYPSTILAMDDEHGLVGVGVHRYHLADVLASHLVRDVATERGIRLERDLDGASCNSTVGTASQQSADDDRLREFFEQVAPILTQHRGINAKSRVLMNAVAERLGLTEEELERALATLQRQARDPDEDDPRQLERRESFRAYLRRTMAQLPNGIVTFKTHWRLCQAGEHFHGVSPKWIEPTIKEVASEIGGRFISKDQAIEHVTQLVEDQLDDRPIIDNTTRARIYTEGTRWGLDPMDVDGIIRDRTETLRRQLAAERRRTRRVINFVIGGVTIVAVIIAGMFLVKPLTTPIQSNEDQTAQTNDKQPPAQLRGLPWWNDNLRIAQARLRITKPDLRAILDEAASRQPSTRGDAYEQLIQKYSSDLPSRRRRGDCENFLAGAYALEESDVAAGRLASTLTQPLLQLATELPAEPESIDLLAWSCKVAVKLLKHSDTPILRRNGLADKLDEATGITADPLLDSDALTGRYQGAIARRLYEHLVQLATDDAASASDYYSRVYALGKAGLSPRELDALDAKYMNVVLPALADRWDRYADTIERIAKSTDPNSVIKLLDIYRGAADSRLRNYIAGLFFDRLGAAPGTLTEPEMIEELRESLGVASQERLLRNWTHVDEISSDLLSRRRVEDTNPDVLVQEAIELAHAATLACALSLGKPGAPTFEEMKTNGPPRLALSGGPWSTSTPDEYTTSYPLPKSAVLESHIGSLASARSPQQRMATLKLIANQTERVPDINEAAGQALAEYLVAFKSDEEERQNVLSYAAQLGQWNAVRLGLADQLLEVTGRNTEFERVLSALLGTEVSVSEPAEREELRKRLLADVLTSLAAVPYTEDPKYQAFDDGNDAMRDIYAQQAKLLNVPAEDYQSATRASEVVVALINHMAPRVSASAETADDKDFLASLPYQIQAVNFVANTDLQYLSAVQRLWLRVLSMYVLSQSPKDATSVRQLLDASASSQASEPRVFEQLRDVQSSLLQMWLKLRPSFESSEADEAESS